MVGMLAAMPGFFVLAALALTTSSPQTTQSRIGINPPKLVILISVDQFRGDYVERYAPYFLPAKSGGKLGGFKFLMETGAHFRNALHDHIPTSTGPGHATLMSGSEPAYDGIAGNDWYDRDLKKSVYCVYDPNVKSVGADSDPESPHNLLSTTVGDELKMATNGRSKVIGVSLKDRAAILMAGHAADSVIWYDAKSASWVSSTWYAPSGQLPGWVKELNAAKSVDKLAGQTWEPILPDDDYVITRKAPAEARSSNGKTFSHQMPSTPGKALYGAMGTSRFGNEIAFEAVEKAIDAEQLGQHDVPDILVVNLASNDYVGHRYGPNSPEVMDMTVRTDRLLSHLFNKLQGTIPGGIDNVAIVLTGDHGVVPIPEESNGVYKTGAIRAVAKGAVDAVQKTLSAKYGEGEWVLGEGLYEQKMYLNRELAAQKGLKMADVEDAAAEAAGGAPGVFAAFGRTQILTNCVPSYPFRERLINGFNNKLSGDLIVLEGPGDYADGGTGTGHQAIWDYDAHVPIFLRARGIKPGGYLKRVYTNGIASTLCRLLGIEVPTGNVGTPLLDSFEK